MTGREDSGRCSFCGREQKEVGALFSRGDQGICAPCVELAVAALDREVEQSLEPGEKPLKTLERHIERHRRLSDLLLTFGLLNPTQVPGQLVEALEHAAASSRALEAEVRRWTGSGWRVTGTDPQIRIAHVAAKLVALLQPLRAWRATLPASVPGEVFYAIDQALTALATLARVLNAPAPEGRRR